MDISYMKQKLFLLTCLLFFSSSFRGESRMDIQMQEIGGVYQIPCKVNGVSMNFIFDTGASNVCISLAEALYLYKNGYINSADIGGTIRSQVADGSIVENTHLNIRSLEIGGIIINNVDALVVSSLNAPLLLGQSAIQRLGHIEINGSRLTIINSSASQSISQGGVLTKIKDWWNDGWHYEYDYAVYKDRKFELYSKVINGNVEYKIKDTYLDYYYPVEKNSHFGDEEYDPKHYKYKYVWGPPWEYFNIKGDNVEQELAWIQSKKWKFVKMIDIYSIENGVHQTLSRGYGNLYWRESDNKFMMIPCGTYYNGNEAWWHYDDNGKRRGNEPEKPRKIMVEEGYHNKYYEVHKLFDEYNNYLNAWVSEYRTFTHKAAEYSFNL